MSHSVVAVQYDSSARRDFQDALKRRVFAYVKAQPSGRFASRFMWFKVVVLLIAYWGTWASLALFEHTLPVTAALIVLFAGLVMAVAYNISHDAVHRALSPRRWVNELLFHGTFTLLGPNASVWRLRHRIMHHNCVNIPGLDYNIEAADILRFAPSQRWRPMHRYQHLYAPIAYMAFTFHWVFVKDFQMLRLRDVGNVTGIEHPPWRLAEVVLGKLVYVGYMVVVPWLALDYALWQVLCGFAFYQAFVSFQFVLTFVGSHLNEGMVFVEQDAAGVPHSFLEHSLRTSLDFHPTNPFVSFWFGGFNAHVAHHMFPQVCSVHYPAITRIIQDTCAEYGMPYRQLPLWELYAAHFRYLRDLGDPSRAAAYRHQPA